MQSEFLGRVPEAEAKAPGRTFQRIVTSAFALTLCTFSASAQIVEDGDIAWETEWSDFASRLGEDPATWDFDNDGIPDQWQFALSEKIIVDSTAPAHYAGLVDKFNANLAALQSENPAFAAEFGLLATLGIARDGFTDVDALSQDPSQLPGATWSSVDLTDSLYVETPEAGDGGDPDADGIINQDEGGADQATFISRATTSKKEYRLATELEVDLLDAAYYNGGQRAAFWGQLNNAGDTVAFYSVDYTLPSDGEPIETDLGDPSSWRALTADFPEIPQSAISWSPDDSKIFVSSFVVDVAAETVTQPQYFGTQLNDTVVTSREANNWAVIHDDPGIAVSQPFELDFLRTCDGTLLASDCLGGDLAFEWDTDAEGWTALNHVANLTATAQGTLAGDITDLDPHITSPSVSVDAASNPFVVVSSKQTVESEVELFWTRADSPSTDPAKRAGVLNPGPSGQFNTVVFDLSAHPEWTGTITSLRIDPQQNFTRDQILALPILPNGDPDANRSPVYLTNFPRDAFPNNGIDWPALDPNFASIAFVDNQGSGTAGVADNGDIYVLTDIDELFNAPRTAAGAHEMSTLAPTKLEGGFSTRVRISDVFTQTPAFSQDSSLLLYGEDTADEFRNADFFGTLAIGDWDVGITRARGNAQSFILNEPGNQAVPTPTRGGTRVLYIAQDAGGSLDIHLFATSLEVCTTIEGTQLGETTIDGEVFDQVLVDEDQEADDASGTKVQVSSGTTTSFPDGAPQEIQIETPVDPVTEAQIPDNPETREPVADAIPVVRNFGPSGTRFDPPIAVTISYTDKELTKLGVVNESNLKLFLFNDDTGQWDIEVVEIADPQSTDLRWIESRDTVNNTITFRTRTFSSFGIGGSIDTDGDGISNSVDLDDDADGIPDTEDAFPLDTDNDGVPNADEPDDDGDGIDDSVETFDDADGDGVPNSLDSDSDGDGLSDILEGTLDIDGDSISNFLDLDSDGDGVSDEQETQFGSDPFDPLDTVALPLSMWPLVMLALALLGIFTYRRQRTTQS